MKKLVTVLLALMLVSVGAMAQDSGLRVDKRQSNQLARIRHGLATGDLTRREAIRLLAAQRGIRRTECIARADGNVSARERMRLHRLQRRAHHDIFRERHDRARL